MAAEINQLFEEGVTRCGELTDAADEAMNAVDATAEQARELAERVQEEATEAREHLRDLATRLAKAGDAIGESRGEAQGALEGLAGRAADLRSDVGQLLDRVQKAAAGIEEQRTRLDDSLDAHMTEAQADVTDLARKTQEMEAEAARRLDEAGHAIAAFRATVDAARAELAQKREAWSEALERLEGTAQEQANAFVVGLQSLLQRQGAAIVAAANVMVDRHNDTMDVIKQEFAEEAPQLLSDALEPVQAALRALGEAASAREQSLTSRLAELEAAMESQGPPLDELRTALESAARLG
jgi:chromosome segregation ATPase